MIKILKFIFKPLEEIQTGLILGNLQSQYKNNYLMERWKMLEKKEYDKYIDFCEDLINEPNQEQKEDIINYIKSIRLENEHFNEIMEDIDRYIYNITGQNTFHKISSLYKL